MERRVLLLLLLLVAVVLLVGGFAVRQSEVCACRSSSGGGVDIKEERLHARGSETLGLLPRRPDRGHTDGQRHKALGINFSAGARNFGT